MDETTKHRWFDFTVNVQSLIKWLIGLVSAAIVAWWMLVGRVSALEQHDVEQDAHFARIEGQMQQQRQDTAQQLRDISSDVKEIRTYLITNAAGTRPDVQRWSK